MIKLLEWGEGPPVRFTTKKCPHCKTVTSILAAPSGYITPSPDMRVVYRDVKTTENWIETGPGWIRVECRGCKVYRPALPVKGKYVAGKLCDGRCMSATGHQCECHCGGKNHGRNHDASYQTLSLF